jgi:hypothetical protein
MCRHLTAMRDGWRAASFSLPRRQRAEVAEMNCSHSPVCPDGNDPDAAAAIIVADHCEQGWYRLCNGLILFDDGGCLLGASAVTASSAA